ncbi:MAG: hypothetical protein LBI45_05290 [Bacteroidales bacterium]|nr:hypothetical protein [Bacteroidales bacterium]
MGQFQDDKALLKADKHVYTVLEPLCKSLGIELNSSHSELYKDGTPDYFPQYEVTYKMHRKVKNQKNLYCFVSLFEAFAKLFSQVPGVERCELEW